MAHHIGDDAIALYFQGNWVYATLVGAHHGRSGIVAPGRGSSALPEHAGLGSFGKAGVLQQWCCAKQVWNPATDLHHPAALEHAHRAVRRGAFHPHANFVIARTRKGELERRIGDGGARRQHQPGAVADLPEHRIALRQRGSGVDVFDTTARTGQVNALAYLHLQVVAGAIWPAAIEEQVELTGAGVAITNALNFHHVLSIDGHGCARNRDVEPRPDSAPRKHRCTQRVHHRPTDAGTRAVADAGQHARNHVRRARWRARDEGGWLVVAAQILGKARLFVLDFDFGKRTTSAIRAWRLHPVYFANATINCARAERLQGKHVTAGGTYLRCQKGQ